MAEEKKNAEMSVEQKLKSLYTLQTMLSEIDSIKNLRGELPLEVEDMEAEVAGLTVRITRIQDEVSQINAGIAAQKNKIEAAKASVEKYKEQLNDVKNNREYDTLSKEIEFQELEIELCNKKIREASAAVETKKAEIQKSTEQLTDRRTDLEVKKSELDEIITETKAEEEKLRDKCKKLEVTIEPRLLTAFKRIRKNSHNGLGIVYVERDACGGCFNKIPPQRQLDIRMRKKVIVCEYCGRIMIDPELAGVNLVKAEEPKKARRRATRKKAE